MRKSGDMIRYSIVIVYSIFVLVYIHSHEYLYLLFLCGLSRVTSSIYMTYMVNKLW